MSKILTVRLYESERAHLEAVAAAQGATISHVVREAVAKLEIGN